MAIKYFIAKCERKSSKHPEGNNQAFEFPVSGETQPDARNSAKSLMCQQDSNFQNSDEEYEAWYKNPQLQRITEEEFNTLSINLEAETNQVELLDNGTYSDETCDTETSQLLYQNNGDKFKGAKVFIRQVSKNEFAYGFKYMCDDVEKHEPMTRNHLENNRDDAIESGITRLSDFLDFRDEQNVNDEEASFISALLAHDFYREFEESKDIIAETLDDEKELGSVEQIMDALSEHRQLPDAVQIYSDFLDTVESHMNDIWPNDKSPKLVIEHIQSMQTVDALYQRDVCVASFEQYLPQADLPLTEKTIEAKKNIEKALGITAANDSVYEPIIKAAYYDVSDEVNVVLTTHNYGDQGFAFGFEINPKNGICIGCAKEPSDEFFITEKEAIKAAGQAAANELMKYDTSLTLYKKFAHSPYVESFEQNATVLDEEDDKLRVAIRNRYDRRPRAITKEQEVNFAHKALMSHIREDTVLEKLIDAIDSIEYCNVMYSEPKVKDFVALFTPSMFAEALENDANTPQATIEPKAKLEEKEDISTGKASINTLPKTAISGNKLARTEPKQGENLPKVESLDAEEVIEQQSANDPTLTNYSSVNRSIWDKVCKTQNRFTKKVKYGEREYTAVDVDHQIEQATNLWGCYGEKWGLTEIHETERGTLISAKTTFFYPSPVSGERIEFSLHNSIPFKRVYSGKNGSYESYDDDYFKKLESNFLSRAFAKLGWNADVRQGKFEDAHYQTINALQGATEQNIERIEQESEASKAALNKAKTYVDKFSSAPSLAEIKRLEKLARTALEAHPISSDDHKRKKEGAMQNITTKAQAALNDFNKDLKQADKEQANG
ncbi:hypothetical protein [Vibrio algivorus]|uniref:Uncharacterized protein n=1 Tax=Vibrio algivorus TaxID=1667024 RepID=A0A557P9P6_9VIBR|nr:hypothetical protein [Vibrio algivorus]TVO37380.1 hypothetical protein FOF44_07165 [Vibrio algivorus]